MYGFGSNRNQMLGLGDKQVINKPEQIEFFNTKTIFGVGCGDSHSVFLQKRGDQEGGSVWVIGLGSSGRLGCERPKTPENYEHMLIKSDYSEEKIAKLLRQADDLLDSEGQKSWHLPTPVRLKAPENVVYICCGADHTLALTEPGIIYAWGLGSFGNLGTGTTDDVYVPDIVKMPEDTPCCMVAAGTKHSMALTREGGLMYSWGHGGNGRLGQGDRQEASLVPGRVLVESASPMRWIAAGEAHSASVDILGNVFCWGAGTRGRTGHGEEIDYPVPKQVRSLGGTPCKEVALGALHSMALAQTGGLHTWGTGCATGHHGVGGMEPIQPTPQELTHAILKNSRGAIHIAAGSFHSLALLSNGNVIAWGNGSGGRLGQGKGKLKDQVVPEILQLGERVDGFAEMALETEMAAEKTAEELQPIYCGGMYSAMVKSGELWTWGSNDFGQLGFGDKKDRVVPSHVLIKEIALSKATIDMVALGLEHAIALTTAAGAGAKLLFSWGRNQMGQLGLGNNTNEMKPKQIGSIVDAKKIAAGEDHSAAILVSGELYTWGSAQHGKLGHGSSVGSQNYPRQLRLSDQVDHVSCGAQHTAILNMQGHLFTFGSGWFGRLGHGDLANQATPKRVESFDDENELREPSTGNVFAQLLDESAAANAGVIPAPKVRDVHCGAFHTLIITEVDGRLWCCGRDTMICESTHIHRPIRFGHGAGVFARDTTMKVRTIAVGANHTLCLMDNGSLWAWGDNSKGQLGLGMGTGRAFAPGAVSLAGWATSSEIVELAAGYAHSMAALRSGAVYSWGFCAGGRLGHAEGVPLASAGVSADGRAAFTPAMVDPQWMETKLNDQKTPAAGDDQAEEKQPAEGGKEGEEGGGEQGGEDGEGDQAREDAELDTLGELQRKLHREPIEHKVPALRAREDYLSQQLEQRFFKNICSLWDKPGEKQNDATEWELEDLKGRLDRSLCRNLRRLQLSEEYPNLDSLQTHHRVCQVLVHYEELMWVLQQQPCYLARLSQIKLKHNETHEVTARLPELLPRVVGQIFREVGDSRTRHLFVALICRVIALEIPRRDARGPKVDAGLILDARSSKVHAFMAIFVRHAFFTELHRSFFDADNDQSLVMKLAHWTLKRKDAKASDGIFALEVNDLLDWEKAGDESLMSEKERAEQASHLRARLQEHQKIFYQFLGLQPGGDGQTFTSFLKQLQLHPALQLILGRAAECIFRSSAMPRVQGPSEALEQDVSASERRVYEPVTKLLMTSVFGNLLEHHEAIMSGQMLSEPFKKRVRTILEEYLKQKDEDAPDTREIDEALPEALKRMHYNLNQLGKFLVMAARKDFKTGQSNIQSFANSLSGFLLPFAKQQAEQGQDDLSVRLTVDLYTSHYDVREHFVMMRTTELLHLSNSLWLHASEVIPGERPQEDHLYKLLDKIQPPPAKHKETAAKPAGAAAGKDNGKDAAHAEKSADHMVRSRLWHQEVMQHCAQHEMMHNFTLSHRFLGERKGENGVLAGGLCFCRDSNAPVPRTMAREDQRRVVAGSAAPKQELLRVFQEASAGEEFRTLGSVIASKELNVDLRSSKNFLSMQYKLEEAQKALNQKMKGLQGTKSSEGYSFLTEIEKGKRALNHLRTQGVTMQVFTDYLLDAVTSRERQSKYLQALEEELNTIDKHRQDYIEHLKQRLKGLKRFVEASENVEVPSLLRNKASDNGVRLRLADVERQRLREEKRDKEFGERNEGPDVLYPSATFSLFNLLAKKVVRRMGSDLPAKEHRNIFFTFNCVDQLGNWEVMATHRDRGKSHMLCTFSVTQQEIERMKRAGKCEKREFNEGFVVMSCFNLLQLLARIRATNIKG